MKSLWRRNEDGSVSRSIDGGKNWLKSNWALVPREVLKAFANETGGRSFVQKSPADDKS